MIRQLRLLLISELLVLIMWLAPKPKTKDDAAGVSLIQSIGALAESIGIQS